MPSDTDPNYLYYGDNLEILQLYIGDETVDLVYLDPPFNSNADYNVLFAEHDGTPAHAQFRAFEDTWRWDTEAARNFRIAVEHGGQVANAMMAFETFLGHSDMLAYLSNMAPRLVELRRVLKPTGSIYLHCDPTASHYLKLLMDAIFGPVNFQNEIVWKRTSAHNDPGRWGRVHDVLLFYSRDTRLHTWNSVFQEYDEDYLAVKYRNSDERGPFRLGDLTGAGTTQGDSCKPWRGHNPVSIGRHWAAPRKIIVAELGKEAAAKMSTQEKLDWLDANGYIYWTPRGKGGGPGFPQYKRYLIGGVPVQDVIEDIAPINSQAAERLGYPTQKPEDLLERIINASSNEGDVVLDPFCGCGTAIAVAQRLNRRWIGIDVTHLAINLIKVRLSDAFGGTFEDKIEDTYEVIGEPRSVHDAQQLAKEDPFQFQCWALGLVGARPAVTKKGADKGIDGRLFFHEGSEKDGVKHAILSVKGGKNISVKDMRDLIGVVDREKSAIGVLITMTKPTKPMTVEAAGAGFYTASDRSTYPKIQILTIEDLLDGKTIQIPGWRTIQTFKKAPKAKKGKKKDAELFE